MSCGCKIKPLNVPQNVEWGPLFWKVLHGLAECSGSKTDANMQRDEKLLWNKLLTKLHTVLPCSECREHLASYIQKHPVQIPDNYSELSLYVRQWLHALHEDVNARLGKQPYAFHQLVRTPDLSKSVYTLTVVMKRAIKASALPILSWIHWSNHARTLSGMY